MKNQIDWLNHSLEFIVVLIGILIAFQLNKCSDDHAKANLLENHLHYLRTECQENQSRLESAITHIHAQLMNCDSLLTEITEGKDITKIRNFSTRLLDMRPVDLVSDSYRVLVESGDIRYLDDYDQKRRIITLYESFDDVQNINDSNQKLYDNHFYPYLKENFDLVNWAKVKIQSKEEASAYYSNAFGNTISTYRYLLNTKMNTCKTELKMIEEYLRLE